MDNLQEYLKRKNTIDKKYSVLGFFRVLLIMVTIIGIVSSFIITNADFVLTILYSIGILFCSLLFYIFTLVAETIFNIDKKINKE